MTYKGRATTTGNSRSFAFESALFKAYPEFAAGKLVADPISPRCLVIRSVPDGADEGMDGTDPVLGAFLEFTAAQISRHPHMIRGLSHASLQAAQDLVGDMDVDPNEDLGEEDLL